MNRIIGGGTGLIGRRLVASWLQQNHDVMVIGRSQQHTEAVFGGQVKAVSWDNLTSSMLESAEVIVNLAGANVLEKPWMDVRKAEIQSSRNDTTKKIVELLAKIDKNPPPLFIAGAVSIYGTQVEKSSGELPLPFDEDTTIDRNELSSFVSAFCRRLEKTAEPAMAQGVRVVLMRFGVVLAKEGGVLPRVIKPFKFFMGGPVGTGHQPFPWVAIDDLVRAIEFLIPKSEISGVINIVSPGGITQGQLAKSVGKLLHRPSVMPMPAFLLKLMLGERSQLLLKSQHVYPKRLLDLGFHFNYSDIDSALRHVLNNS